MKINIKEKVVLKEGDTKEVVRFAFLPVYISNTQIVWMEKYIETFKVEKLYKPYPIKIGRWGRWREVGWEWVNDWVSTGKKVK